MNWQEYWGMNAPSPYGDMQGRPMTEQEYYMQQQMMYGQQRVHAPTKKDIVDSLVCYLGGASEVEKVDDFETLQTRHICRGTQTIQVLSKCVTPLQTVNGSANVEYFFCPQCRKLIINKSSIELL